MLLGFGAVSVTYVYVNVHHFTHSGLQQQNAHLQPCIQTKNKVLQLHIMSSQTYYLHSWMYFV